MRRDFLSAAAATAFYFLFPLVACSPRPYAIHDEAFAASDACDAEGAYEVSMEDGNVSAKAMGEIKAQYKQSAGFGAAVWCHGLRHVFIGRVEHAGYVFESDADDPLLFVLDRDRGYYYESGTGTVTDPEGEVHTFP